MENSRRTARRSNKDQHGSWKSIVSGSLLHGSLREAISRRAAMPVPSVVELKNLLLSRENWRPIGKITSFGQGLEKLLEQQSSTSKNAAGRVKELIEVFSDEVQELAEDRQRDLIKALLEDSFYLLVYSHNQDREKTSRLRCKGLTFTQLDPTVAEAELLATIERILTEVADCQIKKSKLTRKKINIRRFERSVAIFISICDVLKIPADPERTAERLKKLKQSAGKYVDGFILKTYSRVEKRSDNEGPRKNDTKAGKILFGREPKKGSRGVHPMLKKLRKQLTDKSKHK